MIEVLIISQGSTFTVDSLEKSLRKEMVYTLRASADVDSVKENISGKGSIILLYGGEYLPTAFDLCDYIKTICGGENQRTLGVIGYENELADAENMLGKELISFEIKRPFDIRELVDIIRAHEEKNAAEAAAAPAEKPEEPQKPAAPEKHSILLCDDDIMFLRMMQDRLSSKYSVTSVKSGVQAISYISRRKPDLILLDYEMPVTSGPQVMEMIRSEENSKDIPIVFLTGKSDRDSVITVMRLKPTGYLLKSTKKEDIFASIDNFFKTGTWKMIQI